MLQLMLPLYVLNRVTVLFLRGVVRPLIQTKFFRFIQKIIKNNNIDTNCVQFIENKNKKIVDFLLSKMSKYIDVIVPRGGKVLVAKVQKFSNVHVIGHFEGICHIYLDQR